MLAVSSSRQPLRRCFPFLARTLSGDLCTNTRATRCAFEITCVKLSDMQPLFIDRDPEFFHYILNYMRDGPGVVLPDREHVRARVNQEAHFYG